MTLIKLAQVLRKSWSKETSYCPNDWANSNPSFGQCAVSALVVNDYLGGEIVWADALLPSGQMISHYFNVIDGKTVDLTRSQFPKGTIIPKGIEKKRDFASTREFMLTSVNTEKRYELLKEIVRNNLAD
jgi:hypothetical protein